MSDGRLGLSVETAGEPGARAAFQGPMPPYRHFTDFLPEPDRLALLDWTMTQQERFKPAKVFYGEGGRQSRVDPNIRIALKLWDVGPLEPMLQDHLLAALPEIMKSAGYNGPEPRSVEFQLNAYGEGARFAAHRDIIVGKGRKPIGREEGEERLISAVYYFHGEPKGFSGGELRLYRFGVTSTDPNLTADDSITFEPLQNSLLVFPAWAKHAVEVVRCPSGRFADYRFALNCWFCRRTTD